jgi:Group II intron, maturase-specific domain
MTYPSGVTRLPLMLSVHPGKTHVVDLGRDGFDFLGFHFHKRPSRRTGRLVPYAWPSQKAMQTVREKIRQQTEPTRLRVDLGELVGTLNRIIRGWRAYFVIGNSTKKLADRDRYVWLLLRRFLKKRQGSRGPLHPTTFAEWERWSGLAYFHPTGRRGFRPCMQCITFRETWMARRGQLSNNFQMIRKPSETTFDVFRGTEAFAIVSDVRRRDGQIVRASMDNVLDLTMRMGCDAALVV